MSDAEVQLAAREQIGKAQTEAHRELSTVEEQPTILQVIASVARQSGPQDLDKMERLFALAERGEAIQREISFNEALARLQPKLPRITKRGRVEFGQNKYNFAKYEDLMRFIQPLLAEEGFSLSFDEEFANTTRVYICTLSHVKGHSRQSRMALPPDTGAGRNALQALGSTDSYMRRYLVIRLLNIVCVDTDDDAQSFGFLTDEQRNSIEDMIREAGLTPERKTKFLETMNAKSVSEINRGAFITGVKLLQAMRKNAK